MTEELLYSVWLQIGIGAGANFGSLLSVYGSPEEVYRHSASDWRFSGALLPGQIKRLSSCKLENAYAVIKRCESLGYRIITFYDREYPELLKHIANPPLALYVSGDVACLSEGLSVAVVGSRTASNYSLRIAETISADIASAGVTVVSGGALGVDSAAHEGALRVNGKTVAVLGCGINTGYLKANEGLRNRISKTGALLSEYPPDEPASSRNFPVRNRIISGLSRGTLVIEAGEKSGSLITAKLALEQGRDVFAVPGDITSLDYTGVNKLIREGAKPVFSAKDVLSEYVWIYDFPNEISATDMTRNLMKSAKSDETVKKHGNSVVSVEPIGEKRPLSEGMSEDSVKVYGVFCDKPLYTDEIVDLTKLEPNRVLTALTELEIYGFIKMIQGKRYIIV